MRCVKCGSEEDRVIDSRAAKDGYAIRRRRECLSCGHRFTTYEQIERNDLHVIKRNGTREPFRRSKLLEGMLKSCEKRPVSIDMLEAATDDIMMDLQGEGHREVPTAAIGPKVMKRLQEIDQVAYIRYASVYREFQEVGDFIEVIANMKEEPPAAATAVKAVQPELFR